MPFVHGRIWKQNQPAGIKLFLINPQEIVPEMDLAANSNEELDVGGVADAEVTAEDAAEDLPSTQWLQSERRRRDEAADEANPSEEAAPKPPEMAAAPPAPQEEARRRATRKEDVGEAPIGVGARGEEGPPAPAAAEGRAVPAPEISVPALHTRRSPLWIPEANVKRPLKLRVSWVSRVVLVV